MLHLFLKRAPGFRSIKYHLCFDFFHPGQPTTLQNFTPWCRMVIWWLRWHRTILMKNIRQKQYSRMHAFGKPWWGVASEPCVTNRRALYAWVIRWHVTDMLSWHGRRALSKHVCAHSVISMCFFFCSTLGERAMSNLGQPPLCLSIVWSKCRNAYRDLWIMTIQGNIHTVILDQWHLPICCGIRLSRQFGAIIFYITRLWRNIDMILSFLCMETQFS